MATPVYVCSTNVRFKNMLTNVQHTQIDDEGSKRERDESSKQGEMNFVSHSFNSRQRDDEEIHVK